jgi:ribosomal protein S18 acetylase RimI-like enzyme
MTAGVRRIAAEDWALARAIRLRALANAPDAFARTFDEELAMPDARWQERALANEEGLSSAGFFALCEDVECGLAVGVWCAGDPPIVELNALWVAPEARRSGAGRALIEAVCDWARGRGAARVDLEVTESSLAALALYRAQGFDAIPGLRPADAEMAKRSALNKVAAHVADSEAVVSGPRRPRMRSAGRMNSPAFCIATGHAQHNASTPRRAPARSRSDQACPRLGTRNHSPTATHVGGHGPGDRF